MDRRRSFRFLALIVSARGARPERGCGSASGSRSSSKRMVWAEPFTVLRMPKLFDLRADPYERADVTSNTYYDWMISHGYVVMASSVVAAKYLETYREFPPSQRAASFTIDQAMEKLQASFSH
jgi:arylsulfatase